MTNKKTIIISLGGSIVVPGKIAIGFLKNFKHCILKYSTDYQFIIFVGGGKVCRIYQKALADFGANSIARDYMGIKIAGLNAEILKQVFADSKNSVRIVSSDKFEPGHSTDYDAVLSTKTNNADTIINLTNIDYVFDKDPSKFPTAKAIEKINWPNFRKIVGEKWTPGYSSPFDPTAAKLAQQLKIKVAIINGKYLSRLEDFLNNKKFIGTIIE
jgi:uridylate kinase